MIKRFLAALIAAVFISQPVFAGEIYLNNIPIGAKITAIEKDGYMFLPLRKLADTMGAKLEWNDKTKTATIYNPFSLKEAPLAKVTIGKKTALVYPVDEKGKALGEAEVEMNTAAFIKDSYTYIPLDFIAQNLGYEYEYDKKTGNIYLSD